jgi:hypothetical protein
MSTSNQNLFQINESSEGRFVATKLVEYSQFPQLKKFISEQKEIYLKNKVTDGRPIWIDILTNVGNIIDSYQSQSRSVKRKLEQIEEKYFRKAETNRLKNRSAKKEIDNLRYLLSRAARLSTINFMPASMYDSTGLFKLLDRGNVMEEQIESVSTTHSTSKFTKSQVISAITEIEEAIGDSLPVVLKNWKAKVESEPNSKKFSLYEIIGKEGIDEILNEIVNVKIMVSDKIQAVNEMVNFNGKNNPWFGPHYLFQYLDIYNKIDNDILFEKLSVGKEYSNLRTFVFGSTEPDVWETLPQFPTIAFFIAKKIASFDWDSKDPLIIEHQQKILTHAFEMLSREKASKQAMDSFYKEFIGKSYNAEKDVDGILKIASALDSVVDDQSFKNITDRFSELEKAINYIINNPNASDSDIKNAKQFNKTRIKELIKYDSWKLLLVIPMGALGAKFSQEQTSKQNVTAFLSIIEQYLTEPIQIKKDRKGIPTGFGITSQELENILTEQGTAYHSKLKALYPYICKAIGTVIDNVGDGSNDELKDEEITFIDNATDSKDWYWFESDSDGNMVKVGARMGKALSGTSWQHLEDAFNRWEYGCLQHVSTNSGDRRKKKPNKLKSYERKLEDVEQYYDEQLITKTQYRASCSTLESIIDALNELDK